VVLPLLIAQEAEKGCAWYVSTPPALRNGFQDRRTPDLRYQRTARRRGRGERKRPTSGRASLTPAERDVVRLVSEGLTNNDIATRLFVSPRTVQTHLTHVYSKLGLTSRVQLVQEAARHP
jgi:DNA-binding CsgD family transcriptional regulator